MDHYDRYYDQQSSQDYDQYNLWQDSRFHDGFHLTQHWGEDSEPSQDLESSDDDDQSGGESKESERKVQVRRVVSKAEMTEDPEPYCRMLFNNDKIAGKEPQEEEVIQIDTPPSQPLSGYDWTQTWKKGDILDPDTVLNQDKVHRNSSENDLKEYQSGMSTERNRKKMPIENYVQRRIMKAVSQPITISKATSMMERMGWKGGPLGKNSDGIAEPIAPNATYITKKGFGLEERVQQKRENPKRDPPPNKRAKLTKNESRALSKGQRKKLAKKSKIDLITTNALIQILEFVRNDREIEIEFDKKLAPIERKIIHNTVQFITEGTQELDTIDYENECHLNLLEKIHECNYYTLSTESEGTKKQRHLCLYKEAKDHMYLITPDDLSIEDNDHSDNTDQCDDLQVKTTTTEEKVTRIGAKIKKTNEASNKVSKNDAETEISDINIAKSNIIDRNLANDETNRKEFENTNELSIVESEKEENTNPFLRSIERIQNNLKDDIINLQMEIDVSEEISEITEKGVHNTYVNVHNSKLCTQMKIDSGKTDPGSKVKNRNSILNNNIQKNTCTNTKICTETYNTEAKNVRNVQNKDLNKNISVKNHSKSQNVTENLIEYFKEFLDEATYTEFRFLGPFDLKETREINMFLDSIYNCIYSGESGEEYNCLLEMINGEELYYYEVKQDCNGGSVIYKCKTEDINT